MGILDANLRRPIHPTYLSDARLRRGRRSHDAWGVCYAKEVRALSIFIVEVYQPTAFFTSIGTTTKKKKVVVRAQRDVNTGTASLVLLLLLLDGLGGLSNLASYLPSPRRLHAFSGDWRRVARAQVQSPSYNNKGGCNQSSATLCGLYSIG